MCKPDVIGRVPLQTQTHPLPDRRVRTVRANEVLTPDHPLLITTSLLHRHHHRKLPLPFLELKLGNLPSPLHSITVLLEVFIEDPLDPSLVDSDFVRIPRRNRHIRHESRPLNPLAIAIRRVPKRNLSGQHNTR